MAEQIRTGAATFDEVRQSLQQIQVILDKLGSVAESQGASMIAIEPAGALVGTDVQAALEDLDARLTILEP